VKRLLVTLALATVALAAAACGSTSAGNPTPAGPSAGPADPNAPVITAKDLKFDQAEVAVPAAKPFQLTFTNLESAPHNVAIYTDASASTPVSVGEIFSNETKVQDVPALEAGTYFFRCDVHPDMKGTLVAK
jgi:plastocyanin